MNWSDITLNINFLTKGLVVTLKLASISIIASLFFGLILGLSRNSKIFPLNFIATFFIEVVRSIPLILFVIFVHFGLLPYITGNSTSFFFSSFIALTIFTSAYIAEIVRSGLNSIERGHIEAAKSLGLNSFQRLFYVILPLSLSRMTPALVSQFISLIKDTSLASTIGLIEQTRAGEIIYERTYHELEILIFVAMTYFVICYSLSLASKKLESKTFMFSKLRKFTQLD